MWTPEEERQLSASWMRAEAERQKESEAQRSRDESTGLKVFELPAESTVPTYQGAGHQEESSIAMLRRANVGTCDPTPSEPPLTDDDLGMSRREFDGLTAQRQLAIANAAWLNRSQAK